MRWKWLLLLSLLSISLVSATSGESEKSETENVELISESNSDTSVHESSKTEDELYDEVKPEEVATNEHEHDKDEETTADESPVQALNAPVDTSPAEVDEEVNEDTVDVESIKPQKTKGKYMNYEDYVGFNLDVSDNNYNWNGKSIAKPFSEKN